MGNIFFCMSKITVLLLISGIFFLSLNTNAQNNRSKSVTAPVLVPDTSKTNLLLPVLVKDNSLDVNGQYLTLKQCIEYALIHQPALNIASLNMDVTRTTNAISLAGLLPQVNASGNLTHNIQRGFISSNGTVTQTKTGYANTFIPGVEVSQSLFNPGLLYAYKSAPLYEQQARQATDSVKIFLVAQVSKSFYTLLNTLEQINVLKEDTARLGQSVRDAYHQYKGGIVDETDYEEAAITLNNSRAQLRQAKENVVPQYAFLKRLIGFPAEKQFNVTFDTLEMMNNIHIDTNEQLQYEKRIEFQVLNTGKALQSQMVDYYKFAWLPTLSAFYNYNLNFQNNNYNNILNSSYPTSLIGLSFSMPIFTGFARTNNVHRAQLEQKILDWRETDLKSQINTEYSSALASYRSNYYNLQLLQKNVAMARRVYFVVTLQYKQGIVPYLNVITAESNLISSEISYLNALFQVLSNKIDLQKAMGNISY